MPPLRPTALACLALPALAACAAEPDLGRPFGADARDARQGLAAAAERGPVRLVVLDPPASFGLGTAAEAMAARLAAEGVSGRTVRFAADAASPEPHLVLAFGMPPGTEPGTLCGGTAPAGMGVLPQRLTAVWCDGPRAVADLSGTAGGTSPADTERLVWRATARLFPDDYEDSYGWNLFGDRLRVGLGGSFGF